ncbi:hypothetical protein SeLEV6574_g05005 [Synchytrium endobioticum]|uniref:Superoxide dismutase [Cu-Zn] n=1 Tax=Synchytrium endobioticum TaxID=286115 RepID=A0A507CWN6_9FUNG|nr:hypothetical protein SeLEV6574_g05005 [Synchytrium endobioticum]
MIQRLLILLFRITAIHAAYVNLAAPFTPGDTGEPDSTDFQPLYATARLFSSLPQNSSVQGIANLIDNGVSTTINVRLVGLTPGAHGIHIHKYGDLSQDCANWGDHFDNPVAPKNHGAPDAAQHHLGDLGNLNADAAGTANFSITVSAIRLRGDLSAVGRGLVIHAGQDDLGLGNATTSLVNGNAGARVACGVIGWAAPPPASTSAATNVPPPPAQATAASTNVQTAAGAVKTNTAATIPSPTA